MVDLSVNRVTLWGALFIDVTGLAFKRVTLGRELVYWPDWLTCWPPGFRGQAVLPRHVQASWPDASLTSTWWVWTAQKRPVHGDLRTERPPQTPECHRGSVPHFIVLDRGSVPHFVVSDRGSIPHFIVSDRGSVPHFTVSQRGSVPHFTVSDRGSVPHFTVSDWGSVPHFTVSDRGSVAHFTVSDTDNALHFTVSDRESDHTIKLW